MSVESRAREEASGVPPNRFAAGIFALLALTALSAGWTSFHPAAGLAKLALLLVHLVWIGFACQRLLGLPDPRGLALATLAMLGQVVALTYVYLRSTISDATGLPGIGFGEALLAESLLALALVRKEGRIVLPLPVAGERLFSFACQGAWLAWLFAIASQKLDLYFTPSSDPDIHAFYTRVMLEKGHLFYDLEPLSDAWMIYPSGFSCINLVFGRLAGLHPVQIVNLGPYLQLTLFMGCGFALLARGLRSGAWRLGLGCFFFATCALALDPLFMNGRAFLEGTPRLAHTALLFFPLFFTLEFAMPVARRPLLLFLPAVAAAVGMGINPTHAPLSVVMGALALVPLLAWSEPRRTLLRAGVPAVATAATLIVALVVLVLAADPFYRGLARQQLGLWGSEVESAERLTGSAFRSDYEIGPLVTRALRSFSSGVLPPAGSTGAPTLLPQGVVIATLVLVVVLPLMRRRLGSGEDAWERESLTFVVCAFAALALHAAWTIVVPGIVEPGVLQSVLLLRYTISLQTQASLAVFSVLLPLPFAFALHGIESLAGDDSKRALRLGLQSLVAIGLGACLIVLRPAIDRSREEFHAKLRESPLGTYGPNEVAFARGLEDVVPAEERVLLPGRLRRTGIEHWIFTTEAGRALPLFGDTRTSFFLGLDGRAFTPDAYEAHVQKSFDPEWLHAHRVEWVLESGNFPQRLLKHHYELVTGTDRMNLWRLNRPSRATTAP